MTAQPETALPPETHIGRVALRVGDRKEQTDFYRDLPHAEWPVTADGSVHMKMAPLDLEPVADAAGDDDTRRGSRADRRQSVHGDRHRGWNRCRGPGRDRGAVPR